MAACDSYMDPDYELDLRIGGATIERSTDEGTVLVRYNGPIDRLLQTVTYQYELVETRSDTVELRPVSRPVAE